MTNTHSKYAVIDTETSGLSLNDQVIELGIVFLDENLNIVRVWECLFWYPDTIPLHVERIHGITFTMRENANYFHSKWENIAHMLNGHILVGHNIGFDIRMIRQSLPCVDPNFETGRVIDTYQLTDCLSLANCINKYALCDPEQQPLHRALNDARYTAKLFRKLYPNFCELPSISRATPCRIVP